MTARIDLDELERMLEASRDCPRLARSEQNEMCGLCLDELGWWAQDYGPALLAAVRAAEAYVDEIDAHPHAITSMSGREYVRFLRLRDSLAVFKEGKHGA